jgi:hypothetical protein
MRSWTSGRRNGDRGESRDWSVVLSCLQSPQVRPHDVGVDVLGMSSELRAPYLASRNGEGATREQAGGQVPLR